MVWIIIAGGLVVLCYSQAGADAWTLAHGGTAVTIGDPSSSVGTVTA